MLCMLGCRGRSLVGCVTTVVVDCLLMPSPFVLPEQVACLRVGLTCTSALVGSHPKCVDVQAVTVLFRTLLWVLTLVYC